MNTRHRSTQKYFKTVDKEYLENGSKFWPGSISEAFFVLEHGYLYSNIVDLFKAFDQPCSSLILLEKRPFVEVVWSAFCFVSNNKRYDYINWSSVERFILFTETINLSDAFLLLLKNNVELGHLSAKKGAVQSLIGASFNIVRLNFLKNFLNFLKIDNEDSNHIISSCLETKDYEPLLGYLINLKENSANQYFEKPPDPQKTTFLFTNNKLKYFLIAFTLFGVTFLTKSYKSSPKILPNERGAPIAYSIDNSYTLFGEDVKLDKPPYTFYYKEGGSDRINSGRLRGGADEPPNRIICSAIDPFANDRSLSESVSSPVSRPIRQSPETLQSQEQESSSTSPVQTESSVVTPNYAVKLRSLFLKEKLEKPDFFFRHEIQTKDEEGNVKTTLKNVNLDYKGVTRLEGCAKVTFDLNTRTVNFGGSLSYYDDCVDNVKNFKERLRIIQKTCPSDLPQFVTRETLKIPNTTTEIDTPLEGDHIEGSKMHRATNREKKHTITVLKPKNVHKALTTTRKEAEDQIMFVKNADNTITRKNKTNLADGHTVEDHFRVLKEQSVSAYQLIDDAEFAPELTREELIKSERLAIRIQKNKYIAARLATGMTVEEQLVEIKVGSAMDESLTDVRRLTAKIEADYEYCQEPSNMSEYLPSAGNKWLGRVMTQSINNRQFLLACKRHFPKPAHLSLVEFHSLGLAIDNLLNQQATEVRHLINTAITYNLSPSAQQALFFQDYTQIPQDSWSRELTNLDTVTNNMTLQSVDQHAIDYQVDSSEKTFKTGINKLPPNFTLKRGYKERLANKAEYAHTLNIQFERLSLATSAESLNSLANQADPNNNTPAPGNADDLFI